MHALAVACLKEHEASSLMGWLPVVQEMLAAIRQRSSASSAGSRYVITRQAKPDRRSVTLTSHHQLRGGSSRK